MSSNYFAVDPDGLAKNAPNVRAYSDQMRAVFTRLQSRLNELGDCWGDDPMGKAFEEQYRTPRDQMVSGLQGIADVLDSTADGLETMAKGFHQTEEQAAATARGIGHGSERGFEHGISDSTNPGSFKEPKTSGGSHSRGSSIRG
jgi:WXG100 family type VII secretion target